MTCVVLHEERATPGGSSAPRLAPPSWGGTRLSPPRRKRARAEPQPVRSKVVLSASPRRGSLDARLALEAAVRDTPRVMSDEARTPDVVELTRAGV
jgi:hypothetical protein